MSRRNIILIATPLVAVAVVVPLLEGFGAGREIVLLAQAVIVVICGGALGAFADPVPELPLKRKSSETARHRR